MEIPKRDSDGYLIDRESWTPEIASAMVDVDNFVIDEGKWGHIIKAREYFDEYGVVPPIRKFARFINADRKAVFKLWMTGQMKPITKYGGLPKPAGCV